jgi:hypothetical protein
MYASEQEEYHFKKYELLESETVLRLFIILLDQQCTVFFLYKLFKC